jgi:hypothetical protein
LISSHNTSPGPHPGASRYGSLEAILEAWDRGDLASLGPAGAAALGLGPGRETARRNLRLFTLGESAAVPEAAARELAAALAAGSGGSGGSGPAQAQDAAGADATGLLALVSLHPSVGGRWAEWAPRLAAARAAAGRLALPAAGPWVCPKEGVPIDLVVRVYDRGGALLSALREAAGGGGGGSAEGELQAAAAVTADGAGGAEDAPAFEPRDCVAVMAVTPWDVAAAPGGAKAGGGGGSGGARVRVRPQLAPGAKRRAALLKACGWRVALLQLPEAGGGGSEVDGGSGAAAAAALSAALLDALGLQAG